MNDNVDNHDLQEVLGPIKGQYAHKPYWNRIHHSGSVWFFLILMMAAIMYYVMSQNFAIAPRQTEKTSVGK